MKLHSSKKYILKKIRASVTLLLFFLFCSIFLAGYRKVYSRADPTEERVYSNGGTIKNVHPQFTDHEGLNIRAPKRPTEKPEIGKPYREQVIKEYLHTLDTTPQHQLEAQQKNKHIEKFKPNNKKNKQPARSTQGKKNNAHANNSKLPHVPVVVREDVADA